MALSDELALPSNSRFFFVRLEPAKIEPTWTVLGGDQYSIAKSDRVTDVTIDGTSLTEKSALPTGNEEWFWDGTTLTIQTLTNPNSAGTAVVSFYLFFTESKYQYIGESVTSGDTREWKPFLMRGPVVSQKIQDQIQGKVSVPQTAITIRDEDGDFEALDNDLSSMFRRPVKVWMSVNDEILALPDFTSDRYQRDSKDVVSINIVDDLAKLREPAEFTTTYAYFDDFDGGGNTLDPKAFGVPLRITFGNRSVHGTRNYSQVNRSGDSWQTLDPEFCGQGYSIDYSGAPESGKNTKFALGRIDGPLKGPTLGTTLNLELIAAGAKTALDSEFSTVTNEVSVTGSHGLLTGDIIYFRDLAANPGGSVTIGRMNGTTHNIRDIWHVVKVLNSTDFKLTHIADSPDRLDQLEDSEITAATSGSGDFQYWHVNSVGEFPQQAIRFKFNYLNTTNFDTATVEVGDTFTLTMTSPTFETNYTADCVIAELDRASLEIRCLALDWMDTSISRRWSLAGTFTSGFSTSFGQKPAVVFVRDRKVYPALHSDVTATVAALTIPNTSQDMDRVEISGGVPITFNDFDPTRDEVYYRLSGQASMSHGFFMDTLFSANGLTLDSASRVAADTAFSANMRTTIPFINQKRYSSYLFYAQTLLQGTGGYTFKAIDGEMEYALWDAPSTGTSITLNDVLRGTYGETVDYQDIITELRTENISADNVNDRGITDSPFQLVTDNDPFYLHGIKNSVTVEIMTATMTSAQATVLLGLKSARGVFYRFALPHTFFELDVGDDLTLDQEIFGVAFDATIVSITRKIDQMDVTVMRLEGL